MVHAVGIGRRDFLKTGAFSIGTLALSGSLPKANSIPQNSEPIQETKFTVTRFDEINGRLKVGDRVVINAPGVYLESVTGRVTEVSETYGATMIREEDGQPQVIPVPIFNAGSVETHVKILSRPMIG